MKNEKGETVIPESIFKTKPFDHQYKALSLCAAAEAFALLMEQGTGKTKVLIDNAALLYQTGKITGVLVIAPNGVHRNWTVNEIPRHFGGGPKEECFMALWDAKATVKRNVEMTAAMSSFHGTGLLVFFAMNIDAVRTERGFEAASRFLKMCAGKSMMIVDESSRIKTPSAKRTKNVWRLGQMATYRRIATGTPVTQGAIDLYAQFKFLEPNIIGCGTFTGFKAEYCIFKKEYSGRAGTHYEKLVGYKNLDALKEKIAPYSYRITKEECLDLPEKMYERRYVELTDEQTALYNGLRKGIVDGVDTSHPLTKLLRLQQVIGGFVPVNEDDGPNERKIVSVKNNRIDTLLECVEEAHGKIIIWARFRAELAAIANALRQEYGENSVVEYHGGIDNDERQYAVRDFQDDPGTRFFVGQQDSGGLGLTLTAAKTVIYYSNNFSLEARLQSEDRAHRIGQKNKVLYIDLVAENTVDEKIIDALRQKVNIASIVTGDNIRDWI